MQELWLKGAAIAGWIIGFAATMTLIFDSASWLELLGVGGYSIGATSCVMAVCRIQARCNRRAIYRSQHWDDTPQENVTKLFG